MGVLKDQVANLEQRIQDNQKEFQATLEQNNEDHKRELSKANAELVKEYNEGREDATQEMLAKQSGGEVVDENKKEEANPFIVKKDAPPVLSQADIVAVNQSKEISEIGAPSTISRIDSRTGMILLPLGIERGVEQGNVFTLWKDQRKAARIRVQSARNGFMLGYILPHFGTPGKLRPGDNIHVVPDEEKIIINRDFFFEKRHFLLLITSLVLSLSSCFTASPDDDRMPHARPASWEFSAPGFDRGGLR